MRPIKLKRTTLICIFLGSLLCGLFLSKFTEPIALAWLFLLLMLLPIVLHRKVLFLFLYCIISGLLIGWFRGGILQDQNIKYQKFYYEKVWISGRSTEDSVYNDKLQIAFTIEDVAINGQKMPGKIKISGFGEPMVYRHDLVKVSGKLYPIRGGSQASVSYATIEVKARASSVIEDFRRNFVVGMQNALPEPAASLAVGILVGQRSLLPDDVVAVFMIVGLTHIVAVSGYNLTIIVRAVTKMLRKLSKFQILAASLFLIYLFLLVTGFSPSIVRASIVSLLSLAAWYFGRTFRPILLILLAAAITGFYNPYYVWSDIGWYLSFLAFFGVLIIAPLLSKGFKFKVPILGQVAIESLSAQIMTIPLVMMIFGRLSIIGLLANIIIVPLVPFAMLLSLTAGLVGMVAPSVAAWVALPARVLLDFMLFVSTWFAKLPMAQINAKIDAVSLVLLYCFTVIFIIGLNKRTQNAKIKAIINN